MRLWQMAAGHQGAWAAAGVFRWGVGSVGGAGAAAALWLPDRGCQGGRAARAWAGLWRGAWWLGLRALEKTAVFAGPYSRFAIFFDLLWVPFGRVCGVACGVVACGWRRDGWRWGVRHWPLRPALAVAPRSRASCFALTQRPGNAPGGALTFFAPAKESKQRKAAPRQRPCTSLRCAALHSGQTCDDADSGGAAELALRSAIAQLGQLPQVRSRCHCMLRCNGSVAVIALAGAASRGGRIGPLLRSAPGGPCFARS